MVKEHIPKDAINIIREARRAGVRMYYDLEAQTSKMRASPIDRDGQRRAHMTALKEDSQSVTMRLRWEANERAAGQRECPLCESIDWVDSLSPRITVRPGGGQLMESWACEDCQAPYRWHHGTWSYCHGCGATTGSAPSTWTRYVCGTCGAAPKEVATTPLPTDQPQAEVTGQLL